LEEFSCRCKSLHDTPLIADDVGAAAAFLVSDGARYITGNITFVDCGTHVMG
jgi:enoyl-[acyl-carrier-protein] reductase (NADH)